MSTSEGASFTKRPVFRKPGGRSSKRKTESDDESSEDETKIVHREKKLTHNPLVQKTVRKEKTKLEDDDEEEVTERKKEFAFAAERTDQRKGPTDMGATATLEIETPHDQDAQAVFEKAQTLNKELKGKEDDKVYRGLNNYAQYIPKRDTSQGNASSGMVRKGPIRAPTNVRASVRWDYAPDICKDYKETGFCGFGDSCIFLHDRSDYKHGWQLEREVERSTYGKNDSEAGKYEIPSDDEDNLPFKCLICRESFTNPVVTKCKHYFCETCALTNCKKSKRCFACNQQTMGVFNPAKDLQAKLKKQEESGKKSEPAEDAEKSNEIVMLHGTEDDAEHPHPHSHQAGGSDSDGET